MGSFTPANPVWQKEQRYFDALRPSVEPTGLEAPEMVLAHRKQHLGRVRKVFQKATVMVFTFGLTEAWIDKETGTVYPTAPGTIAGAFNPDVFAFKNFNYAEVLADFERFRLIMKKFNPEMRFLLTVSP